LGFEVAVLKILKFYWMWCEARWCPGQPEAEVMAIGSLVSLLFCLLPGPSAVPNPTDV